MKWPPQFLKKPRPSSTSLRLSVCALEFHSCLQHFLTHQAGLWLGSKWMMVIFSPRFCSHGSQICRDRLLQGFGFRNVLQPHKHRQDEPNTPPSTLLLFILKHMNKKRKKKKLFRLHHRKYGLMGSVEGPWSYTARRKKLKCAGAAENPIRIRSILFFSLVSSFIHLLLGNEKMCPFLL